MKIFSSSSTIDKEYSMSQDDRIAKYIIISDKIKNRIKLHGYEIENVILSINMEDDIPNLIKSHELIFVVLFIHIQDLEKIDSFLMGKYNYTEIAYRLIVFGSEDEFDTLTPDRLHSISELRVSKVSLKEFKLLVQKAFLQIERFFNYKMQMNVDMARLMDMRRDQEDLIDIGKALSTEKDPDDLLKMILHHSKKITGADAGSIYIIEKLEDESKRLRFKYSHTFSRDLPMEEYTLPINQDSIAGYVATTGEVLNISDAYKLSPDDPISHNPSFDSANNYKSRSMLVVPMKNHIGEIIGVIQLINSKEDITGGKSITGNEAFEVMLDVPEDFETKVFEFDERYESLMESVAGQAAIAIENNRMIKKIQNQFEEFVRASVTAVESRDVSTSGHSFRVADICTEMAKAINNEQNGPFDNFTFTDNEIKELEYAALLHDFGKVYVDISIFKKAKKLFHKDFENLILRLNYLYRFIELGYVIKEGTMLTGSSSYNGDAISERENINRKKEERLDVIKRIKDKLIVLNEPTITEDSPEDILNEIEKEIKQIECYDIEGNKIELITGVEKMNLQIERGSLNPVERKEIESHVIHAFNFVESIPWPTEYKNIPSIVLNHHEKIDGTGYPNGIKGKDDIPIQSRIMAIADIFDALAASDRPYKKAVNIGTALSILKEEAERNKIDGDLLNVFIKNKIYEIVSNNTSE